MRATQMGHQLSGRVQVARPWAPPLCANNSKQVCGSLRRTICFLGLYALLSCSTLILKPLKHNFLVTDLEHLGPCPHIFLLVALRSRITTTTTTTTTTSLALLCLQHSPSPGTPR
eukprot:152769-Pelagomonas_calceolata.AAC.1